MSTDGPPHGSFAGVILLLAAAVGWSLSGALIKLIYADGQGPHGVTIAFYRSLFAGLCLLPLSRGKFRSLRRQDGPRLFLRFRPAALGCVVFFTLMTGMFVVANTRTESANVIILQYTSTFWVFGLSPRLLGERPRNSDRWILALAMVGIAVIFGGNLSGDLVGLLIALGSGLFFALLTIMIRLMRDADSAAVTVFNMLGSALLLLPVVLLVGDRGMTLREWLLLGLLGVVQFGLPYYLYSLALARVPAYHAGLLTLTEPILNPGWTYLAVAEAVPVATMLGGGVILFALVLFVAAARKEGRRIMRAELARPAVLAGAPDRDDRCGDTHEGNKA